MALKISFLSIFFLLLSVSIRAQMGEVEITTVLKEQFHDKNGNPLTGKGVVIGDVDSGIDIFHPMFFFADGDTLDWVDVDRDGKFTSGVDGIDLNRDGKISKDEMLRYIKMKNNTWTLVEEQNKRDFDPAFDFLYLDKNGNRKRDFGPGAGFTEKDPTYGEQLYVALDANHNGRLDPGEKIVALKTSKVRAVREKDGTVRRRGVDLIYTEEDSIGHGTGVAGIILGGQDGIQRIHGIAPDAEIVVADIRYNYTPRFVRNFYDLISFVKEEKTNILLFEDGEWMWEFMDGSSPEEQLVDEMAREGVTVVGGAGNFATGDMLIIDTLAPGANPVYIAQCPDWVEGKLNNGVFFSFLWTDTSAGLDFTIETPDKIVSPPLNASADFIKVGKYNISYAKEISPKGTVMFKLGCSKKDSGAIDGEWRIHVKNPDPVILRGYIVDISQSWAGHSHWDSDKITGESSVTFPCTADSLIAVGAYVVNFGWFDKIGDLANYSSRGYNIDGKMGVDITAPGHTTFTTEKDNGYMTFSGTSSAAPHVVGAAALLLQYDPSLSFTQVKQIIHSSAKRDKFTGAVPNPAWGWGKLDIESAIKYVINNY
ncbi:MAG: S8 family serine peptidase [Ignavibacteria bacterium]|jgi:subtilisin family serine protease